jgi:hypothetical protein
MDLGRPFADLERKGHLRELPRVLRRAGKRRRKYAGWARQSLAPRGRGGSFCLFARAQAGIFDATFTDVTTRGFAVVWVAGEAVTETTVRVYSDPHGITEITHDL